MGRWWGTQKILVKCRNAGIILFFLHSVCIPVTWADEPTPEFLIRQVINTYRSLATYQVTGQTDTEITDFNQGGKVSQLTHRFTILMKKPNGYHITWEDDFLPYYQAKQGAVWNSSRQAYVYNQSVGGYMKIPTDFVNLRSCAGVSTGSTLILPALFFAFFPEQDTQLSMLKDPVVKGREEVDGVQCYVLEGRDQQKVVTYWIATNNFLIHQYALLIDQPNGREMDLDTTEEEAKADLRAQGLEPTKERIKHFIRTLEISSKALKQLRSRLIATHHFSKISLPDIHSVDLEFSVPDGMPLKVDLWGRSSISLDQDEELLGVKEE